MMTNVMTNTTSRQKVIAYLGQHKGASALEISRALQVTPANIRYHLSILRTDGRVQCLGSRQDLGRGRPIQVYAIGETAFDDNLAQLVDILLDLLGTSTSREDHEQMLKTLAARLLPILPEQKLGHITRRLAITIDQLNKHGYEARWEAHAVAPRMIFEHCPYAIVIARHPELCRVDQQILAQHLGATVKQTAFLEKTSRGTRYCQFQIRLRI